MAGDPIETLAANLPPPLAPYSPTICPQPPSPIQFPTTSSASPVSLPLPSLADIDPTPFLVLNYLDLVIDAASVVLRISDLEIRPDHVVFDAEDEILVLAFDEAIPVGKAVLAIGFSGVRSDHMRGFGRSKHEVDGIKRNMAVTQFEPVEAGRCLQCWDVPALKATFKITLEVPTELIPYPTCQLLMN